MNVRNSLYLIIILLWSGLLFFINLGDKGLWSSQEARNALAAQTMLDGPLEEWVIPTIAYEKSTQKPVLFYWLVTASCWMGGTISAFFVRFPSALSGLLCVLYIFYFLSKTVNRQTGFISALLLATSIKFLGMSRTSRIDIFLALCLTVTLGELFLYRCSQRTRRHLIAAYFFAALGVLCKGPVGIMLPGMIWFIFLLLHKELHTVKKYIKATPIVIFFITVLPYYILATVVTDGSFFYDFIVKHNIERFTGVEGTFGKRKPLWYYLPHLSIGLMPWLVLVPLLCYYYRFRRHLSTFFRPSDQTALVGDDRIATLTSFLLVWGGMIFLFFSFASFKRADYLLPVYPPLMCLFGIALADKIFMNNHQKLMTSLIIVTGVIFVMALPLILTARSVELSAKLFSIPLIANNFNENDKTALTSVCMFIHDNTAIILTAWITMVFVLCIGFIIKKYDARYMLTSLILVAGVLYLMYFSRLEPYTDRYRSLKPFAEHINHECNKKPLAFFNFWNHQLFFYLHREVDLMYGTDSMVEFLKNDPNGYVVMEQDWFLSLPEHIRTNLTVIKTTSKLHSKQLLLVSCTSPDVL